MGDEWHFSATAIGAYGGAALAFFLVNNILAGTAWALAERERILPYLVGDLLFQATSTAVRRRLAGRLERAPQRQAARPLVCPHHQSGPPRRRGRRHRSPDGTGLRVDGLARCRRTRAVHDRAAVLHLRVGEGHPRRDLEPGLHKAGLTITDAAGRVELWRTSDDAFAYAAPSPRGPLCSWPRVYADLMRIGGAAWTPPNTSAELAVDDRPAHVDLRLVGSQVGVHDPQRDRLGDPQTGARQQLEERPPRLGDIGQQSCELLAGEKPSLIELAGATAAAPRRQDHRLHTVAEQAGLRGVSQASLQRHHGVVHRAVAEAVTVLVGQAAQPVDEATGAMLVDVAQALVGRKVAQRIGDQQPRVLAARATLMMSCAPRPA
jgi:hypothetical protein